MNIYKRDQSGPYWYRFMYRGTLIRRSSGVYNKQDAMDIAAAYRTQLVKGEVGLKEPEPAPEIPAFSKAMADFLAWSETEYTAHPASHKRYVTSSKVKKLAENNQQDRVVSREEELLYLLACSQPLRDVAVLMLETGMRPEEVCRIRRENVYLSAGYVFNPYGKTKSAKRKIWLNDTASSVIARRLDAAKGDYLFPGRGNDDKPIVKVNAAHNSAVKRSKVKRFTLYTLRHTWATRAAQSGVDIVTLAAMLGHSRLAMVQRYVHPGEEHQAAAMRKIQASSALTAVI